MPYWILNNTSGNPLLPQWTLVAEVANKAAVQATLDLKAPRGDNPDRWRVAEVLSDVKPVRGDSVPDFVIK